MARCAECGFDATVKPLDEFAPEEVVEGPPGFCPRCGARLPQPVAVQAVSEAAAPALAALDVSPAAVVEALPPEPTPSVAEPEDTSPEPPPAFATPPLPTDLTAIRRDTERALATRESRRAARRRAATVFWVALIVLCCVAAFVGGTALRNRATDSRQPSARAGSVTAGQPERAGSAPGPAPVSRAQAHTQTQAPAPAARNTGVSPPAGQAPSQRKPAYNVLDLEHLPEAAFSDKQVFVNWMVAHKREDPKFLAQRWDRAQRAVRIGDIKHRRVLEAFLLTPREKFCRSWNLSRAYDHAYLDIHYGSTISGPHIVARMTDAINPEPSDRVLEIGTGSGYQSGILSNLCNHVYSIEIIEPLAKETRELYDQLIAGGYKEYTNLETKAGDGYYGWEEAGPFQGIIVTCSLDHEPPPLLRQLAVGGRIVIPIGPPGDQKVWCLTKVKTADGKVKLERKDLYPNLGKKIEFLRLVDGTGRAHGRDQ